MNKEEKLIGEFYGLHHDLYDHYRIKDFELKIKEKFIKGILNKHAIPNIVIEKMAFMEAGGSGNKARAMAKAMKRPLKMRKGGTAKKKKK